MPRAGSHAQALGAFYGAQSTHYDRFRERLLQGRAELVADIGLHDGAHVVELGGGTGRNLEFFGERASRIARYDVVDLCAPLLECARARRHAFPQLRAIEADAATWRPRRPVDAVILSYALTMIPDWRGAIANAIAMSLPGIERRPILAARLLHRTRNGCESGRCARLRARPGHAAPHTRACGTGG